MMNWISKYFKNRRKALVNEIAAETVNHLHNSGRGWEKFLPPVVVRDTVYMVTENGSIYAMRYDNLTKMEMIVQIRKW